MNNSGLLYISNFFDRIETIVHFCSNLKRGTIVTKKGMSLIFRGKAWARYIIF